MIDKIRLGMVTLTCVVGLCLTKWWFDSFDCEVCYFSDSNGNPLS